MSPQVKNTIATAVFEHRAQVKKWFDEETGGKQINQVRSI